MWQKANEGSHQWMKISNVELRQKEVAHRMAGADVLNQTTVKRNPCSLRLTHNEQLLYGNKRPRIRING